MLMKESLPLYTDFEKCHSIDPCYYTTYDIKRGLRNADGTGVVVGVTNISNVHGYVVSEGDKVPDRGRLSYRATAFPIWSTMLLPKTVSASRKRHTCLWRASFRRQSS